MPAGSLPPNPDSEKQDIPFEDPSQEKSLCCIEYRIVCLILCAIALVTVYMALWISFGLFEEVHFRLVHTLSGIDNHWKVSLFILVLLFFRPIRRFLLRVKKFAGAEVGDVIKPNREGPGPGNT